MIAEALEYLEESFRPAVVEFGDALYGTVALHHPPLPPREKFPRVVVTSLISLVQYLEENRDGLKRELLSVVVGDPKHVAVVGEVRYLDEEKRCPYRDELFVATAAVPDLPLGTYVEREQFQVLLASRFEPSADRDELLKLVGNLEAGNTRTHRDDGITQEVVVRSAVATKAEVAQRPIVELRPFRTFLEVAQPLSPFLFRIKDLGDKGGITCALFEADGGAWQIEARRNVAEFLEQELEAKSIDVPVLQ